MAQFNYMPRLMLSYYDQFPEFNGQKIHIRNDGYVSVKDINKAIGKRFNDWTKTKFAKDVLDELSLIHRIPVVLDYEDCRSQISKPLIDYVRGGQEGAFVHPSVAFAYSMSNAKFFARVASWITQMNEVGVTNPHVMEWTKEEYQRGVDFNRDDINQMYPR